MSNYPKVYGFCDAGCKRQTISKEELEDRFGGIGAKLITLTGQTITVAGSQLFIQLTSDKFVDNTLIELYPADDSTRLLIREYANDIGPAPYIIDNTVYIPLLGGDDGVNVKFIIRINYSTEITGKVIHLHI